MSSFTLKILAVIFMLIDHIGYAFFPKIILLRIVGRLAMPLFAFQVALGYKHTKDKKKHLISFLLLALISQIPYMLLISINSEDISLNIVFSFLFAQLIISAFENIKGKGNKILISLLLLTTLIFIPFEYKYICIPLVILFYYFSENKLYSLSSFFALTSIYCSIKVNVVQLYCLLAIIPLLFFNNKRGPKLKWFFYIFYPSHMLILFLIHKLFL